MSDTCTDTHGDSAQVSYDFDGNVVTTTDALLHATIYGCNFRDRKVTRTDRVSGVTTYSCDQSNHLLTIADADSAGAPTGATAASMTTTGIPAKPLGLIGC